MKKVDEKYYSIEDDCSYCGTTITRCSKCRIFFRKGETVNCVENEGHYCNECAHGKGYSVDRVTIAKALSMYIVRNEHKPVGQLLYELFYDRPYKNANVKKIRDINDIELNGIIAYKNR